MVFELLNSVISFSRLASNQYLNFGYKFLQHRLNKFQRGGWIVS